MGKNQSASNLPNIIQYSNGSINFVSGSTLLMQISSSGAITTTGVISGSNALSSSYAVNADQLDGFDSTAFVFTSSFNTYSSSMSTRVGRIEGNYATTGSNVFLGAQTVCANITSTGTIIAQTLNVQQVTSSIVYSSGSNIFGCQLTDTQQMTGSVRITGSLTVTTAGTSPEFQVNSGGTIKGNALTDTHQVTGSLRITGSLTSNGTARFSGGNNADVNNAAVRIDNWKNLSFYNCADTGWAFTLGADQSNNGAIGANNNLNFNTSPTLNTRATITSTGITCFACQVCAPVFLATSCIGIGTDTPQAPFHICTINATATVRVESACDQAGLRLIAGVPGTARASRIDFLNGATCVGRPQWTIINDYNQNGTNDLSFINCDPVTRVMTILQNGNIGIGCTSPDLRLVLRAPASNTSLMAIRSTTGNNLFNFISNSTCGHAILDMGRCTESGIFAAGYIRLRTDGDSWIQGGNVGINTTSPCARLHIQGAANAEDLLYFCTGGSVNTKFVFNINSGADDAFVLRRNHTTQGNLCIMSWTYNGYVGIGTSSPDTLLTLDTQIANSSTGILASLYASKGTAEGTYLQIRGTRNSTQSVRRIEFQSCDGSSNAANIVLNPNGGCIGIGTFTPGQTLSVQGNSYFGCLANTLNFSQGGNDRFLEVGSGNGGDALYVAHSSGYGVAYFGYEASNDRLVVATDCGSGANKIDFILNAGTCTGGSGDNLNVNPVMRITACATVGINTTDPKANFHVCGGSATLRVGPWFSTNDRDFIQLEASGTDTRILSPNERFKIENPDGCVQIVSGTSGGVQLTPGATSWASMSDIRKKKNFEPTQGLAALLQIEPVKYHFQWDNDCMPKRMGFIAQNIQPLIPEMVSKTDEKAEDGSDYLTITPDYILPVLVKSIQEQQCTICMQSTIIDQLRICLGLR